MHDSTHFKHQLAWLLTVAMLTGCGGGGAPGSPLACVALPAEITWQRDTGSSEWNDVLIDSQHRIWLAGYTRGRLGESNIGPTGDSRAVVRQWAPDGSLLWDAGAALDSPGTDVAEALAITPQGTVYAAGRTTGSLGGAANQGQFDSFVAWSDTPGTGAPWKLFQTGTETPQHPRRLAVDDQGELLLAGEDDEYVPSNYVAAWSDAFALRLRRLDRGGADDRLTLAWRHQDASPEPDVGGGLAVATGGVSYVSGAMLSGGRRGMYLRKLAADGQPLWTARYSSSPTDHIAAVHTLRDGTLLVGGSVYGAFRGAAWQGQQDVFVARVSADDGRVLQSWQFGSTEGEWLTDLRVDAAGNVYLFGETGGSMAPGRLPAGASDLFLLKLAPDGRVLASHQWGTDQDERAGRLAVDGCGGIVAVGSSGTATKRDALVWFWRP